MATEYQELIRNVLIRLDRADGKALLAAQQAVNESILVVALLFDLPELVKVLTKSLTIGVDYWDLTSSDYVIDVVKVRNTTTSKDLGFLPYDFLDVFIPSTLTAVKYWSRNGNRMFVRAAPAGTIAISYTVKAFPSALSADADPCPYDGHDPQVLAIGCIIAAATLNMADQFEKWVKIAESMSIPYAKIEKARSIIQGVRTSQEVAIGNTVQGAN